MLKQIVAVSLSLLSTACMPDVGADPIAPAAHKLAPLAPELKGIRE